MTEEQIKQNAKAYACYFYQDKNSVLWSDRYNSYIAGAHSRDEEIDNLRNSLQTEQEQSYAAILELKKEIEQLTKEVERLRHPWKSVEDGLPEVMPNSIFSKDCIVMFLGGDIGRGRYDYNLHKWVPFDDENSDVTHWMSFIPLKF